MYEIVLRKKVIIFFQYCNGKYDQKILIIEHILIKKTPVKNKKIQQTPPPLKQKTNKQTKQKNQNKLLSNMSRSWGMKESVFTEISLHPGAGAPKVTKKK